MKKFFLLSLSVIFLAACSPSIHIAKKQHRKGYYVSIGNGVDKAPKTKNENNLASDLESVEKISKLKEVDLDKNKLESIQLSEKENKLLSNLDSKLPEDLSKEVNQIANNDFSVAHLNKKERKVLSKKLINQANALKESNDDNVLMLLILVLLALIIPPIAVLLKEGVGTPFFVSLILTLIAIGGFAIIGNLAGLVGLVAVIHALLYVLDLV